MTQSHVAKLLAILRRADFVKSTRGQLGGYALSRSANKIVVRELLASLGGRLYDENYCGKYLRRGSTSASIKEPMSAWAALEGDPDCGRRRDRWNDAGRSRLKLAVVQRQSSQGWTSQSVSEVDLPA